MICKSRQDLGLNAYADWISTLSSDRVVGVPVIARSVI